MGRDRSWGVRITTAECAVELRCSAGGFCSVALQFGFAVGCEDSEDTGFCPLRIMWCAPEHFKSSQSLVKWAFASLFFVLWYYFGTKVSCAGIVSFMPEAMLFSTQNIHLEKSLHYLISFSFHTIP